MNDLYGNKLATDIATDIVVTKVLQDKQKAALQDTENDATNSTAMPRAHDGGAGAADPDADSDDAELRSIREARIAAMKGGEQKKTQLLSRGHGSYDEIDELQFLDVVLKAERVACHFYHREFERSGILDAHYERIAKVHVGTRFIKMNAEKALFFVAKLCVRTLPTTVLFLNGVAVRSVVGFSEFGGVDKFPSFRIVKIFKKHKVIDEPIGIYGDEDQFGKRGEELGNSSDDDY